MHAVRLTLRGRVQGVSFRAWTLEQARALGISGWVRNVGDALEAHLEGDDAAVSELVDRMRRGPAMARVESFQSSDADKGDFRTFTVRD